MSAQRQELEDLYFAVRNYREGKDTKFSPQAVLDILKKSHPKDWLLSVELYELAKDENHTAFMTEILQHLEQVKVQNPKVKHLIEDGLELV